MERKANILLVDGSNLLFQMFFGMPARIYNEQGIGIWGVLGFVGALLKMIRMVEPAYVAVLFDGEHDNERCVLDAEYKANRLDYSQVEDAENPFSQLPYIYKALDFLGIAYAETRDCETDDWMAGFVKAYGTDAQECQLVIASFDSDFFQLLGERVSILRYRGDKSILFTKEDLWEKFGIWPEQYGDFKSMTGDKADNIVGAPKIGPKTASALLQQFGSLQEVLARSHEIQKPSVRKSIVDSRERLLCNQQLICLSGGCKLPFTLEEMAYEYAGITTTEVLRGIGLKQ